MSSRSASGERVYLNYLPRESHSPKYGVGVRDLACHRQLQGTHTHTHTLINSQSSPPPPPPLLSFSFSVLSPHLSLGVRSNYGRRRRGGGGGGGGGGIVHPQASQVLILFTFFCTGKVRFNYTCYTVTHECLGSTAYSYSCLVQKIKDAHSSHLPGLICIRQLSFLLFC